MNITDVRVRILNTQTRLKAVSSITIDNQFAIHDIRIIESEDGLFLAMPSRKAPNGKFFDICHPINSESRKEIEDAIFEEYKRESENSTHADEDSQLVEEQEVGIDAAQESTEEGAKEVLDDIESEE